MLQGVTKELVSAARLRDIIGDYGAAYETAVSAIMRLFTDDQDRVIEILRSPTSASARAFRKLTWMFIRDPEQGLPSSELPGRSAWHPRLQTALERLCQQLRSELGLSEPANLGHRVKSTGLGEAPLIEKETSADQCRSVHLRIDTVHGVKGETLDAVLFLPGKRQLDALMSHLSNPSDDEELRISYVAMTRPRHLLWLGIPDNIANNFVSALCQAGFRGVQDLD